MAARNEIILNIIRRFKHQLHRDLISNPAAHGWTLNLYLNGERYPQRVCDYFQYEYSPSPELADLLRLHKKDEHKHVRLLEKSLRCIGEEPIEIPIGDVFNEVVRDFTPGTFHIVESDPPDVRRTKLANFLAHAHFLERRIASSLRHHCGACETTQCDDVAKLVAAVLRDEERHVEYTREAVFDLLTHRDAHKTLDAHRRAEARANLMFSKMQLRVFTSKYKDASPFHRRIFYQFCASFMDGAGSLA